MQKDNEAKERQEQEAKLVREKAALDERRKQEETAAAKKSIVVVEDVQVTSNSPGKEQHSSV